MHCPISLACALPFSLSLLSPVTLRSLPRTLLALCLLVFVFQMGLQPPVVVLEQVLDTEPTIATTAVATKRLVTRGAEEMEEKEEHRHPRRLGALLFRSQETRDHKSAPAWSMYVLWFCFQTWLFVVLRLFS